jgi:hypothetical protein
MHWTNIDRARPRRRCGARRRVGGVPGRIGKEFRTAASAAEEIALAHMLRDMLGRRWIDAHAADGVLREGCGFRVVGVNMMRVGIVFQGFDG